MTPAQHNEILQEFENLVAKIEKMAAENAKSDYGTLFQDSKKELEQLRQAKSRSEEAAEKEITYLNRQLEVQKLENRRLRERLALKDKLQREALEKARQNFSTKEKQPQMPHWTSNQDVKAKDKTNPKQRIYVINDPIGELTREDIMSSIFEIFGLPPIEKSKGDE